MPTDRELAARFGTSRVSVREAIQLLETLQMVEVRQGSGIRVTSLSRWTFDVLPGYARSRVAVGARRTATDRRTLRTW